MWVDAGMKQEIPLDSPQIHNDKIQDPGHGKHLWIMLVMYKITPEKMAGDELHLDKENLLTIEGPGCFKCEKHWTPEIGRRFCIGVMP